MRILFVFGYPLSTGGHIKSALAMARSFVEMGHFVIVTAAPDGDKEVENDFVAAGVECIFIRALNKYLKFPTLSGYRNIIGICRERSVDIIHAQDVGSTGRSYLAASLLKKPFVFTQPGGPLTHHIPPHNSEIVLFSEELLEGFIKKHRTRKETLHLIRSRIDMAIYKSEKADSSFVAKYNLPPDGKKVVMALRLIPQKSPWISAVMRAAEEVSSKNRDVHFIIAGEGPLLASLREAASTINEKNSVKASMLFTGPIHSTHDMVKLYNYADVVVGHGRGILEAMACSKPVIVVGENGEGEALDSANIEEVSYCNFSGRHFRNPSIRNRILAQSIEELLNDNDKCRHLGKFSLEYIKTKMDARLGAAQLIDVYKQAIAKTPLSIRNYISWYFRAGAAVVQEGLKRLIRL